MRDLLFGVFGVFLAAFCLCATLAWIYLFGWAAFSLIEVAVSSLA